ncbi:hypothetical protein PVAP13_1NG003446 [Panicum virgatum]|uniref:Reverse transcriptase n=1 Tax=Panicum virgatum TaxID=38727 RepID=A0A8T0WQ72_PANVG|nr:hypothetical protein PVAP13_1NG003446 [Panicum virgatum]
MLQDCSLQAMSSLVSDHCPLLLVGNTIAKKYCGFRFEVFWPRLQRTGAKLRQWSRSKIGNVKLLLCAAKQLIGILDVVDLKAHFLGLSAVEKIRAKQQSRLTAIKEADAQSKLFFLQINGRKRKNYIRQLQTDSGQVHTHVDKEQHIFDHFSKHFGPPEARSFTLDWERLGLPRHDLSVLEEEFTEEEVHAVVMEITADKAPGPDGYIGAFYKATWKGKFLNKAGRLTVLKAVLSSIPTYFLTVFQPQKWMTKQIDKLRRGFLWKRLTRQMEDVVLCNGKRCSD